jgi:hypothetical protein
MKSLSDMFPNLDWAINTVRPIVLKNLELAREAKLIGKSSDARIIISGSVNDIEKLFDLLPGLPEMYQVSQVELKESSEELNVEIQPAQGEKCNRCKRFTVDVASHPYWPLPQHRICPRCADVLLDIHWPPYIPITDDDVYICADEREWHERKGKYEK